MYIISMQVHLHASVCEFKYAKLVKRLPKAPGSRMRIGVRGLVDIAVARGLVRSCATTSHGGPIFLRWAWRRSVKGCAAAPIMIKRPLS